MMYRVSHHCPACNVSHAYRVPGFWVSVVVAQFLSEGAPTILVEEETEALIKDGGEAAQHGLDMLKELFSSGGGKS